MNDSELLKELFEYYPDEPDNDKTFTSSITTLCRSILLEQLAKKIVKIRTLIRDKVVVFLFISISPESKISFLLSSVFGLTMEK